MQNALRSKRKLMVSPVVFAMAPTRKASHQPEVISGPPRGDFAHVGISDPRKPRAAVTDNLPPTPSGASLSGGERLAHDTGRQAIRGSMLLTSDRVPLSARGGEGNGKRTIAWGLGSPPTQGRRRDDGMDYEPTTPDRRGIVR